MSAKSNAPKIVSPGTRPLVPSVLEALLTNRLTQRQRRTMRATRIWLYD